MAEKPKQSRAITNIYTYQYFNHNDATKNKKLSIAAADTMMFSIYNADEKGKIKSTAECTAFIKDLLYNETKIVTVIELILERLARMSKGEMMDSDPIILYNKMNYKESTFQVLFDAYNTSRNSNNNNNTTGELSTTVVIAVKSKKEDGTWNKAYMYLPTTTPRGIYAKSQDYKMTQAYMILKDIHSIMLAWSMRVAPKREQFWKDKLNEELNSTNKEKATPTNQGTEASTSNMSSYDDDIDVF